MGCSHKGAWTRFADLNGDHKAEMTCDDAHGGHWAMLGHGGWWNPHQTVKHSTNWCSHAGSYTQYADLNGDGKYDITCNDNQGRHWSRYGAGYSWYGSVYHGAGWCKGGITRYANWW